MNFRTALMSGLARSAPVVLALGASLPPAAHAAAAAAGSGGAIEEVVVTAQKRAENVQNVPIAITAFTAKGIRDRGITDIHGLSTMSPNVNLDSGSPFSGDTSVLSASIRGIGQDDFAFNLDPGVGVYLDGVYLARTIGANVALPDVERVEVLKGPQGTLFGRNTIGGAISIVTRTPGSQPYVEGQATVGSFNRHDFQVTADVPISERLLSTLTFASAYRDGYQKRIPYDTGAYIIDHASIFNGGTQSSSTNGGQNSQTIRGKLLWKASPAVNVTLTGDWTHQNQSATPNTVLATLPGAGSIAELYNLCLAGVPIGVLCTETRAGLPPLAGTNYLPITVADTQTGNIDTTYANGPSFAKSDSGGAGLTIEWAPSDALTVKSISGFRRITWNIGIDLDGAPNNGQFLTVTDKQAQTQFSQELQVTGKAMDDRLHYVAGLFYFYEKGFVQDFVPFDGSLLMVNGRNPISTSNYAGYAHIDFKITPQLRIIAGGRYSIERKKFEGGQIDENGLAYKASGCFPPTASSSLIGGPPFLDCQQLLGFPDPSNPYRYFPPGVNTRDFYEFTPTVGLQYQWTPDVMTYVTWSEGTKSGGWTTRLSSPISSATQAQFNPEKANTTEIGLKSEWMDHRVLANLAGFFTRYDNIQLNQQVGASPVLKNLGTANIFGAELESQALLGNGFSVRANVGYIDAEYIALDPSVGTAVTLGSKLPKTPKWKVNIEPEYTFNLQNGGSVHLMANYTHISSMFNDSLNTPLLRRPTEDLLDLSVRYESPGGKYAVIVGGTNVTDRRYVTIGSVNYAAGFVDATFDPPAQWYVTLRAKY